MNNIISKNIKILIMSLLLLSSIKTHAADFADPGPGCNPPFCNIPAPINTTAIGQIIEGTLATLGIRIVGDFTFLPSITATPRDGQVLTYDSVLGKIKWADVDTGAPGAKMYNIFLDRGVGSGYDNNITYSICFTQDNERTCTERTKKLNEIIGSSLRTQVSADKDTLNKICETIFPDARYAYSWTSDTGQLSSSIDRTLYWSNTDATLILGTFDDSPFYARTGIKFGTALTCSSILSLSYP